MKLNRGIRKGLILSAGALLLWTETACSAEWGDSPFIAERGGSKGRVSSSASVEENLLLQGILWDPKAPTAIVNNRVVGAGDRVGSWSVVEVRKEEVVLSDGSNRRVLRSE